MNEFMGMMTYKCSLWIHVSSHPLKGANQASMILTERLLGIWDSYEGMWNEYFYLLCPGYECASEAQEVIAYNRNQA